MSAQSTGSRGTAASDDLLQLLTSTSNDPAALLEIVSSRDTTDIVAVISSLLTSLKFGRATSRKKSRYRPALSDDSIVELLLFMDRDTLDSMQLVCRFVRDFIATLDRRTALLALRWMDRVDIGKVMRGRREGGQQINYWTPTVELFRDFGQPDETVVLPYTDGLGPYLRKAYCYRVAIDLQLLPHSSGKRPDDVYRRIFDDLNAEDTLVNMLCVHTSKAASGLISRSLQAFKSVRQLHHEWAPRCAQDLDVTEAVFDEDFFLHAASRGVRDFCSLESVAYEWPDDGCVEIRTSAALAFGFAELESDGDREFYVSGYCELKGDLLTQLCQKASELDGSRHINFKFKLTTQHTGSPLDVNKCEKYYKGDLTWRIDDLKNGVTLKIKELQVEEDVWKIDIEVSSPP